MVTVDGEFVELGKEPFKAPHCNASMLHAPGECYYCDHYPQRQQAYIDGDIPFTPNESNGWSGNVAVKPGEYHEHMGAGFIVGATPGLEPPYSTVYYREVKEPMRPPPDRSWALTEPISGDSLWFKFKRLFRR